MVPALILGQTVVRMVEQPEFIPFLDTFRERFPKLCRPPVSQTSHMPPTPKVHR